MGKGECGDGPFEVGGEGGARGGVEAGNPGGLAFERAFSAPGREYPEVERTAEIRDGKGAVKFRQEGLRFPEAYSQLAVNVVAGKYFYGDVENGSGDPREGRREFSMRQLVARVADAISDWGEADGYFRDAASAGAFRDDLTAILMDQKAAFNSPVWFNVGLFAKYGVRGDTAAWRWDSSKGAVVRIGPGEAYEHPTASACMPYGVRVNTTQGLIPIGDIERGMRTGLTYSTFDRNGEPTAIVKAICNGVRYVMRYRLADGSSLPMTTDHRVFVRTDDGLKEKPAGELQPGVDHLVLGRTDLLAGGGDLVIGPIRVTEDVAWLSGVMVGNGFSGRPDTATSDTWEVKVNTEPERDRVLAVCDLYGVPYTTRQFHWGWTIRGYGEAARSFWETLELWGRTRDKRIPEWVMSAPGRLVRAFARGLFDTDGHVSPRDGGRVMVGFSNVSRDVVEKLQILLRSLGIYASLVGFQPERPDADRQYCWKLDVYDLVSVERFAALIGFTNSNKQAGIEARRPECGDARRDESVLVVSSERVGTSLVYDIQTACSEFWAEGVLVHNCFIQGVEDSMDSIMDLAKAEAMLFKGGSGTGTDLSPLRSTREKLTGGGRPSGPVSFFRVYDAVASVVKSGGKCLSPSQLVFTAGGGAKTAGELADADEEFVVLSYSKRLGRVAAKRARAWWSKVKPMVEVTTDKGVFSTSADHPFVLRTGEAVPAADLRPGQSLLASFAARHSEGYHYVHHDLGSKDSKRLLHRMVAEDVMGLEIDGRVVHHDDEDVTNSAPGNLKLLSGQSEHQRLHAEKLVAAGAHPFQRNKYPKAGAANGMHRAAGFWSDGGKAAAYRERKSEELLARGSAATMQKLSRRSVMLELGYKLINQGHDISTYDGYVAARKAVGRRVGVGREKQEAFFARHFGSYEGFYAELRAGNHEVVSVFRAPESRTVSIEVIDDEPDDRRDWSEHNYAILPAGAEDGFGSFVFVLNTRRAARMQTLKVTHPDVLEFIDCKVEEDRKARALIDAGWSAGMSGSADEAYSSVAFQNTNISIRGTDEFMAKAAGDDPDPFYWTKAVVDGREMDRLDAREVLRRIADGTWKCGDPGMQFDDTINRWNTAVDTERINSSNPCSEYMYINNSACNLASLNLMKFVREDGSFDCGAFEAAVRVVFTAQEVLVGRASYPTAKIAANSHAHRPLGLGYANLGAMLMHLGIPYDSDAGRDLAGAVTALMQAAAGRTSVELARAKGPYPAFAANRGSMLRVAGRHAEAAAAARSAAAWAGGPESRQAWGDGPSAPIWDRACRVWEMETVPGGEIHGYRNAQWSVMAPTGTIAFLMDCATTGIEPDIALVKYKALAGGGNLRIVNTGVAAALRRLGYGVVVDDVCNGDISRYDQVAGILRHIEENDTIEGAPGLKPEHLPVFDCAFESTPGGRTISWEGHVRMMAAIQPFVSGAISKTINLPNSATVDDIRDAYVLSWRLGLKAVAIYRDGSKGVQPLTTRKVEEAPDAEPFPEEEKARRFAAFDAIMGHAFGLAGERAEPGAAYPTDALERTAEFLRGRGAGGGEASAGPPSLIRTAGFPKSSDRIAAEDLRESRFDVRDAVRAEAVDARDRAVMERATSDLVAVVAAAEEAPAPPPKPAPRRERLPDTRRAVNHKFNVGGHEGYINVGLYRDGRPGELFITMAKEGSTIGGLMDAIGTLTSIGLQYGVPMEVLARKLSHVRFEPSGFTKNPDVPMAKSVVDYVFRWLGNEFVAGFRGENAPSRPADGPAPAEALEYEAPPAAPGRGPSQEDAPACAECGAITVRTGACYTCTQCGSSSGCG